MNGVTEGLLPSYGAHILENFRKSVALTNTEGNATVSSPKYTEDNIMLSGVAPTKTEETNSSLIDIGSQTIDETKKDKYTETETTIVTHNTIQQDNREQNEENSPNSKERTGECSGVHSRSPESSVKYGVTVRHVNFEKADGSPGVSMCISHPDSPAEVQHRLAIPFKRVGLLDDQTSNSGDEIVDEEYHSVQPVNLNKLDVSPAKRRHSKRKLNRQSNDSCVTPKCSRKVIIKEFTVKHHQKQQTLIFSHQSETQADAQVMDSHSYDEDTVSGSGKLPPKRFDLTLQQISDENNDESAIFDSEIGNNIIEEITVHKASNIIKENPSLPGNTTLNCKFCESNFREFSLLTKHVVTNHGIDIPYKCDICCKMFKIEDFLERHLKNRHGPKEKTDMSLKVCEVCQIQFPSFRKLSFHREKAHGLSRFIPWRTAIKRNKNNARKPCPHCNKVVSYSNMLKHIRIVHHKEVTPCHICGKKYANRGYIKRHIQLCHDGTMNYSCHVCGRLFKEDTNLKKHIQNMHIRKDGTLHSDCTTTKDGVPYSYICDICGKGFLSDKGYKQHQLFHVYDITCIFCGDKYSDLQALRQHTSTIHGISHKSMASVVKSNSYQCEYCRDVIIGKQNFEKHMKTCWQRNIHYDTNTLETTTATSNLPLEIEHDGNFVHSVVPDDASNMVEMLEVNASGTIVNPDDLNIEMHMCSSCNALFVDVTEAQEHIDSGVCTSGTISS